MKLDPVTANQFLLELSEAELHRFGLTLECLLSPSAQTRDCLCRLLSSLEHETGCRFSREKGTQIDVLPGRAGGCLLIISGNGTTQTDNWPRVFFTTEIDDLIDAARALSRRKEQMLRVTLLQTGAGFLLLLHQASKQQRRLAAEYLLPVSLSKSALAVLQERSRVLLLDAPVSAVCGGA